MCGFLDFRLRIIFKNELNWPWLISISTFKRGAIFSTILWLITTFIQLLSYALTFNIALDRYGYTILTVILNNFITCLLYTSRCV